MTELGSSNDLVIRGPQCPRGELTVSGAKNSATRLMSAAMLTNEPVRLLDFPAELVDVGHKARFIRDMGGVVSLDADSAVAELNCSSLVPASLNSYDYPIRTTYLLAAGQLHRSGEAFLPYPGGCKLGDRKYDLHVMVWERLGCKVEELDEFIHVTGRLRGSVIDFPISTVGGTENALLCASVASGTTEIVNAYVTPEIRNLIDLLSLMGAGITVHGHSRIVVEGESALQGAVIKVIPDRIEALTWMVFAAISRGEVLIRNVPFELMGVPLLHLKEAGIDFLENSNSVFIDGRCLPAAGIQPFEVACGTHPGIISDMQPFMVLLALHAGGHSMVVDYRYPERTRYLEELSKLYPGALTWDRGRIDIRGPVSPVAADVRSTDLRGSMALVLGALLAEGESRIERADMAMRGYNHLLATLTGLGIAS